MKKSLIIIMLVAMMAVSAFAFAGCSGSGNYLLVATNAEFPPFEYVENGNVTGFDYDFLQAIAKEMGYKGAKFTDMKFESIIGSVMGGESDCGAAGMTIKPDRLEKVDFTDTYFNATQIVIYKGEKQTFADEDALWNFLKGKKIGVCMGYTGDYMVQEAIDGVDGVAGKLTGSNAKVVPYQNGALACEALKNGEVGAVVIDQAPGMAIASKFAQADKINADPTGLGNEEYAICVKKGNKQLLDKMNAAIKTLKENGEFDKIVAKYFG